MDIEFVNDWLNKLKEYWFNKDIDKAVALFNKTTFYQETPFMKPYTTIEEINQEWQHVKNENIEKIEIKLLAIDGYTVIAEWILKQNHEEFDGAYCDQRVAPDGVVGIKERLEDAKIRYKDKPLSVWSNEEKANHLIECSLGIEKQIMEYCKLNPEDINDVSIKEYIEKLKTYDI